MITYAGLNTEQQGLSKSKQRVSLIQMFSKQIPQGFVFLPTAALQRLLHEHSRVKHCHHHHSQRYMPIYSFTFLIQHWIFHLHLIYVINSRNSPGLHFPKASCLQIENLFALLETKFLISFLQFFSTQRS